MKNDINELSNVNKKHGLLCLNFDAHGKTNIRGFVYQHKMRHSRVRTRKADFAPLPVLAGNENINYMTQPHAYIPIYRTQSKLHV